MKLRQWIALRTRPPIGIDAPKPMHTTDTSTLSRLELVIAIAAAAQHYLRVHGRREQPMGMARSGTVALAEIGEIELLECGPESLIPGASAKHSLDIWFQHKKVFSIWWNSMELWDYEVVRFKRGPWIPQILQVANV